MIIARELRAMISITAADILQAAACETKNIEKFQRVGLLYQEPDLQKRN
jgi:hypothetical protein